MYHGCKQKEYKFFVSGKWVSNGAYFKFGFFTRAKAENWVKKNNLDTHAFYYEIKP